MGRGVGWGFSPVIPTQAGTRRCGLHWRDEAITVTRHCFDKTRLVRGILQRLAQFSDGLVKPVLEVHKRISRPESFAELISRDHFTGMLEERQKDM